MPARPRSHPRWLLPLLFGVFGCVAGWLGAPELVSTLSEARQLDPMAWKVIVPGSDEDLALASHSGTGILDGALVLGTQAFGRRDTASPQGLAPVAGIDVELAEWSGPLALGIRSSESGHVHQLGVIVPGGWRSVGGPVVPVDGAVTIEVTDGRANVAGQFAGPAEPGTPEFLSEGGESGRERAAITALRLRDAQGTVVFDERFAEAPLDTQVRVGVAAAGGGVAAAIAVLLAASPIGGALLALLLLLAPVLILTASGVSWEAWCTRLYLGPDRVVPARRIALAASLLPLFVVSIVASGKLAVPRGGRRLPWQGVAVGVLVAGVAASRDLAGFELFLGAIATAVLLIPVWTAHQARQPLGHVLVRDLPALLGVAVGTWAWGLLPALIWRLGCLIADVRWFNRTNPKAGVNALLLTTLSLVLGAELTLRGTGLPEVWDKARSASNEQLSVYWGDRCGSDPHQVYFFGGSSTGGAYQFGDEPQAFFPGVLHDRLCAAGVAVQTHNLGQSGRDSWDAAAGAAILYEQGAPAAAVVYLGVNDLLTRLHPLTKKQRAARGPGAARALPIRTVTAMALLVSPRVIEGEPVVAVPIEDAEENLRALIQTTRDAGGQVVLVPEFARSTTAVEMAPYRELEARLADELDGVTLVDPYTAPGNSDDLLADRNHLTRAGHRWLADQIQPQLEPLLR